MLSSPLVSVIIPTYNSENFIRLTLESVLSQSYQNIEIIIVDDNSSDSTLDIIKDISEDNPKIKYYSLPVNTGTPAAPRNYGVSMSKGEFIAFIDSDDLWHPEKLERQLNFHCSNHFDLTVSAYARFIDGQIDQPPQRVVCPPAQLVFRDLFGRNPIPMLTVILSADLARIGFSEVAHEDFLFWLELFKSRPSIRYGCLPEILAFYCIHQRSLSSQKAVMPFWAYRVFRNSGQSRHRSLFSLFFWSIDHILNRLLALSGSVVVRFSIGELLVRPPLLLRQGESS